MATRKQLMALRKARAALRAKRHRSPYKSLSRPMGPRARRGMRKASHIRHCVARRSATLLARRARPICLTRCHRKPRGSRPAGGCRTMCVRRYPLPRGRKCTRFYKV